MTKGSGRPNLYITVERGGLAHRLHHNGKPFFEARQIIYKNIMSRHPDLTVASGSIPVPGKRLAARTLHYCIGYARTVHLRTVFVPAWRLPPAFAVLHAVKQGQLNMLLGPVPICILNISIYWILCVEKDVPAPR